MSITVSPCFFFLIKRTLIAELFFLSPFVPFRWLWNCRWLLRRSCTTMNGIFSHMMTFMTRWAIHFVDGFILLGKWFTLFVFLFAWVTAHEDLDRHGWMYTKRGVLRWHDPSWTSSLTSESADVVSTPYARVRTDPHPQSGQKEKMTKL